MNRKALIVYGGWEGHEPEKVAFIFKKVLEESDFKVILSDSLKSYDDKEKLQSFDLIIPDWSRGISSNEELSTEQLDSILAAIASGVGLAGCHGGLCAAFLNNYDWNFMVGGQFVAHVGAEGINGNGIDFEVKIKNKNHPITSGINDFRVNDEQYYLQVDPAVKVLAAMTIPPFGAKAHSSGKTEMNYDSRLGNWNFERSALLTGPHADNCPVEMPVVWTKYWGKGRIFYNSLGHDEIRVKSEPSLTITRRGFLWAAKE